MKKQLLGLLMFNQLTKLMPKKDYPNNFDKYRKNTTEKFKQIEFEEFMDWKIAGWELPGSIACIIRVDNSRTNKQQEFVYRRIGDAVKRTQKLMEDEDNTITICNLMKSPASPAEIAMTSLMNSLKTAMTTEDLVMEIKSHTHRDELLSLIYDQMLDDLSTTYADTCTD